VLVLRRVFDKTCLVVRFRRERRRPRAGFHVVRGHPEVLRLVGTARARRGQDKAEPLHWLRLLLLFHGHRRRRLRLEWLRVRL
jgi:hypothetical protein